MNNNQNIFSDESSYSGGNIGLNYLYPKPMPSPIDPNNYRGTSFNITPDDTLLLTPEEAGFLNNLFPCLNECKGVKGAGRKDCLRDCRGKGMKKSQLKTMDAETNAKIADALAQATATPAQSSGNVALWIVLALVVLATIGGMIYFLNRKNTPVAVSAK